MNRAWLRALSWSSLPWLLAACGQDFEPPSRPVTGVPAAPLNEAVVDLEVTLPNLQVAGARGRGAEIELRMDTDGTGPGRHPARVFAGSAIVDGRAVPLTRLSSGRTFVDVADGAWSTGRIGPLQIEGTAFEVMLRGATDDRGWTVAGTSWESQTGLEGTFRAWRRHRFLVLGSDFLSSFGWVSEVSLVKEREIVVRENLTRVSSDPVVRVTSGSVFAVNRFTFDSVQRLDPDRDFATSWEASVGQGSNPHDVLVLSGDEAYVTRYEPPFNDVLVISPRGGVKGSTIPLEAHATNPDATPRADRMARVEDAVFVALQDIDRTFSRYHEGKLAVIDPDLHEVVDVIALGGKNPGALEVVAGEDGRPRLFVALSGVFEGLEPQELSGGVVQVDPFHRVVERTALDDDVAGGNVGALAMASHRLGYVVVSDAEFRNRVLAFDPQNGRVLRTIAETRDLVPEIEVDGNGLLAVPDRSFDSPALCLYDAPEDESGAEALVGCAGLEIAPFSVEALD